jgi:hypothetical protein
MRLLGWARLKGLVQKIGHALIVRTKTHLYRIE